MKKLNKVVLLIAGVALTGTALASGSWKNGIGDLTWKSGDASLCWRSSSWTPATAAQGCDGSIPVAPAAPAASAAPKAAPAPAPAPTPAAVPAPAPAAAPAAPARAATPAAPPPPPPPPAVATKVTYASDAFFTVGNAVLKPAGKAKLDDLVAKLKGISLEVIVAVGHAAAGEKAAPALSAKRAEAVKAYLVSKGVEKNRVYTEGKGDKQPVADNKTKEGQAKNRRVEVEVVGTRPNK
jgi:OOP family OmpA-OmpF porin